MKKLLTLILILILLLVIIPASPTLAATDVVNVQVDRDADDCVRFRGGGSSQFSDDAPYLSAGSNSASDLRHGGAQRYRDVDVPRGATIVEAYITITARSSDTGGTVRSYISAEKDSSPSGFSGDNAVTFDKRWKNNTTTVKWDDIESWTKGREYDSPDISAVIQEIVNRSGWKSGNSIVIFWEDFSDRSDAGAYREGHSHDSSSSKAAELYIEYTYANGYDEDDYEDTVEDLETQIESLKKYTGTLNAQLVEMTALTSLLRSNVNNFRDESKLLRSEYASLKNKLETEMNALQTELAGLKHIVAGLETEADASLRLLVLAERIDAIESKLRGKLTPIFWLSLLTFVSLVLIGYIVLRRQR